MENNALKDSTDEVAIKEDDLRREIEKKFTACETHYKDWDTIAKDDYKFALGDQWSKEDRDALADASRPCLTFNRIRPIINIVSGYQRENSARIKVNPEGGEDRIFSEVMDRAIKHIDKQSHFSHKAGYWFDDGCYCGKGFLEAVISYDKEPIRGELQFKQRSPYQVKVDPECLEYDINEGAKYVIKVVRMTRAALKELFPDKIKLINGFVKDIGGDDGRVENGAGLDGSPSDDDYGNQEQKRSYTKAVQGEGDKESDGKFTVKEYWRTKMVKRFYVVEKESGEPREFEKKEEAEAFVTEQAFGKVIERKVAEMWVATYVCGFIIEDIKSPFEPYYSGFPFFRFLADWAPNAESEEWRVQGITRPLKDPQREKNKSKSQYLHIVNTQANSGWIGDEDALTPAGWKLLEKMGSKPGMTIKKKPGKELREILPKGPNQAHLIREEKADEEFKQISNINPDLLGLQDSQSTSGRAMSIRIKQAVLALTRLFANYRYSKEIVGKFILEMVPSLYDTKKLMKVLGPDYMAKALDKEKYPQGLREGNVDGFLQMVKDNRYDVFVAEADQNATVRFEIFQELTELLKAGAPIPMELIIDYMDLPNSQEVKDKVKEAQQQALAAAAAAKGKPVA